MEMYSMLCFTLVFKCLLNKSSVYSYTQLETQITTKSHPLNIWGLFLDNNGILQSEISKNV